MGIRQVVSVYMSTRDCLIRCSPRETIIKGPAATRVCRHSRMVHRRTTTVA